MTEEFKIGDRVCAVIDDIWVYAVVVERLNNHWIVDYNGTLRIPSDICKDELAEVECESSEKEHVPVMMSTSDPRLIEVMKTVEKFLAGKMNVLLREENGFYEIIENKDKKLISLFGKTNGDLQWKLNRWSDGSGEDFNIHPFETQREAEEFVLARFQEIEDKLEETGNFVCIREGSKILENFGYYIKPSLAFSNAIKQHQIKILMDRRKGLLENLARVDWEFAELYK